MNAWNHGEALSFLINFSLDSLKIKKLAIHSKILREERPQVNVYLQAPRGSLKSTLLKEIGRHSAVPVITSITFPALVGSIDKETKQLLPASAWKCRNKPLLIDEWADNENRREVVNALLQLTEGGEFTRELSRFVVPFESEKEELPLFFRAKDGRLSMRTRLSLVLATMHNLLRSSSMAIQALISRCIPYSFQLTKPEMRKIAEGEPFLRIKEKKNVKPEVTITRGTYAKLLDYAEGAGESNYMRSLGDLCRCFAVYGWKPEYFDFILERQNAAEAQFLLAQAEWKTRLANLDLSHRRQGKPDQPLEEV